MQKELNNVALNPIHNSYDKIYKFDLIFLSEGFFSFHHSIYRDQNCQVLVQTDKQKGLESPGRLPKVAHFASMVSQLTKKQPLIIITLTFSRDFFFIG